MSPPVRRPFPRFLAGASAEGLPYGRWEERLRGEFDSACKEHASEAGGEGAEKVTWFPERAWGGRVYIPATGRGAGREGPIEYFGYVSFERSGEGEPSEVTAKADFTDVTAEDNPGWKIDLNEEVIGAWRGDGGGEGEVTLVWGNPLVRGTVAATAELDQEVVDQAMISDGRFTLVAVDAVKGYMDDLYLEVALWNRAGKELARESLYDEPGGASAG